VIFEEISLPIYWPIYRLGRTISAGFHPPPLISWAADLPSRAPPDSRPNPAAFHPAVVVFFSRQPAFMPRPIYRLSRRLPPDSGWFSPRRRRFWPSWTGFASSLDQTEWGMKNSLFWQVEEIEYHIHE
jgi:hypothetical protein